MKQKDWRMILNMAQTRTFKVTQIVDLCKLTMTWSCCSEECEFQFEWCLPFLSGFIVWLTSVVMNSVNAIPTKVSKYNLSLLQKIELWIENSGAVGLLLSANRLRPFGFRSRPTIIGLQKDMAPLVVTSDVDDDCCPIAASVTKRTTIEKQLTTTGGVNLAVGHYLRSH